MQRPGLLLQQIERDYCDVAQKLAKFREQCRYILPAIPWVTRATKIDGDNDNDRKPAPI